jgi:hypothetical protein
MKRILGITVLALSTLLTARAHAEEPKAEDATVVTIDSDAPHTALYRITGHSIGLVVTQRGNTGAVSVTHFERICTAPCNRAVPAGDQYFVDAPGMSTSRPFELDPGKAKLNVRGGNAFLRGLGFYGGVYLGGTALVTGGALALVGAISSSKTSQDTLLPIGLGLVGGGAVALAAGILLVVMNGTDVETDDGRQLATAPKPPKLRLTPTGLVF